MQWRWCHQNPVCVLCWHSFLASAGVLYWTICRLCVLYVIRCVGAHRLTVIIVSSVFYFVCVTCAWCAWLCMTVRVQGVFQKFWAWYTCWCSSWKPTLLFVNTVTINSNRLHIDHTATQWLLNQSFLFYSFDQSSVADFSCSSQENCLPSGNSSNLETDGSHMGPGLQVMPGEEAAEIHADE